MKKTRIRIGKTTAVAEAPTARKAIAATKAVAAKKAVGTNKAVATKKTAAAKKIAAIKTPAPKPASTAKRSGAKPSTAKRGGGATTTSAADVSRRIDAYIAALTDWRGETLARLREIIREAGPEVVEEWKWGIPVWSHDGILCTGEIYRNVVKTTFAHGAALDDPSGLFNSSLAGNTRRAIDFPVGAVIDAKALTALIRAAVALNTAKKADPRPARSTKRSDAATARARVRTVK